MTVTNSDKLDDFRDARADLMATQAAATELLEETDSLEPEIFAELQGKLGEIEELLAEDAPSAISFGIDERIASLFDGIRSVDDPTASLEEAIEHRSLYETQLSEAQEELAEAEELLESTSGEVVDDDVHDQMSGHIEVLKETLEAEPDETSGESFGALTTELATAVDDTSESRGDVSDSHDAWVQAEKEREEEERKAEEEAAQIDPANYESPSERDWALVERDPDSFEGEKYRLYGHVTQADAATGNISIRVDTSPTQKYRRFDYDVNTYVIAGREEVFSDVVKGDHVKMLVEVGGALTYDTTIGGSATAVMVAAYDVEVIGQL